MNSKHIILIGRALGWEEDVKSILELIKNPDVMIIGKSCLYKENIDYFATYHYQDIKLYKDERRKAGYNTDYKVISHEFKKGVDIIEKFLPPSGSSALLGALAAMNLGYERIILCGCPLQGKNDQGYQYSNFWKGWIAHKGVYGNTVRSVSGWTKQYLGYPDKDWLFEKGSK